MTQANIKEYESMKDKQGKEIKIGDRVCFAPAGAYAGVLIGKVEKFTKKQVCILSEVKGRHIDSKVYYAFPETIVVI